MLFTGVNDTGCYIIAGVIVAGVIVTGKKSLALSLTPAIVPDFHPFHDDGDV
jgi:hypothetical protein